MHWHGKFHVEKN